MILPFSFRAISVALLAMVVALSACDQPSGPGERNESVRRLRAVSGDGQTGTVGSELPDDIVVQVVDGDGHPVGGVAVTFTVAAGGGGVFRSSAPNDVEGTARVRWLLGANAAESQIMEVALEGIRAQPLRFVATAVPGPPAAVSVVSGSGTVGQVGTQLPVAQVARVSDRFGNPIHRAEVLWEVRSGGGTVSPARDFTNEAGQTTARWTLGPRADSVHSVRAVVAGLAPAVFTAAPTTAGTALQLTRVSGEFQAGAAGTVLADSLRVAVRLPDGRPVQGVPVTWSAPAQAGTLSPAVSRTNAQGHAAAAWRLAGPVGSVRATAEVEGDTVVFSAFARAGAPAHLAMISGNGGTGPIARLLADTPAVRVTDAYGYPVRGSAVLWTVASGGGSVSATTTDAEGISRAEWILGTRVDSAQTVRASVPGVAPVTFSATAVLTGATLNLSGSGGGQWGVVGTLLADSLAVVVHTTGMRPVQGALVTWTVDWGGGEVSPLQSRTDAMGRARTSWRLGSIPGAARVTAALEGNTVTFSATQLPSP